MTMDGKKEGRNGKKRRRMNGIGWKEGRNGKKGRRRNEIGRKEGMARREEE